jgi:hypothetical protein
MPCFFEVLANAELPRWGQCSGYPRFVEAWLMSSYLPVTEDRRCI